MSTGRRAIALVMALSVLAIGWLSVESRHRSVSVQPPSIARVRSDESTSPPLQRSSLAQLTSDSRNELPARLPASVASRNDRRSGYAWILRQLGADESQLDRLADGDFVPVIKELLKKAAAGDAASINVLGFLAHDECLWGRSTEQDTSYEQDQLASAARSLAPADAAWFSAGLKANNAQRRKFAPVCSDLINQEQILVWLKDRAAQGDGASLWVLARYAVPDMAAYERSMIAAAEAGFPQAQLELAWEMLQHLPEAQGVSTGQLSAVDLLRAAAEKLPDAQASLAICEYSGCEGTAPDVSAALADAHAAALKGRISGLLNMAPHLATGQLSPDEIAAWRLVDAFLELSGCGASNHSVEGVKTVIAAASASDVSSGARRLAAQYWRDNGQDMMASRGCGS